MSSTGGNCECGLKCPHCAQETAGGGTSVCERRQLAHELNRWRGYKRQTVASAMQAHPSAVPLSRSLRQRYDTFVEASARSPHRCNCRCRCHHRGAKKNGLNTTVLATLLRQQEAIERSIDSRPPFAVRHVASELLHRPPGMDPLGPMVHAWNNILEHPDHEDIEFDERYSKYSLRTGAGADRVDDSAIEDYGFPVGGNVPSELGAGTAYCPVCAAYNRYTGHRYRLGPEAEACDKAAAARAEPEPPAEKEVEGGAYGSGPRVRVVRESRSSSSYSRVMPGHELEALKREPAPEQLLPACLKEKERERSHSPLFTSYRYGFGGRDRDLPRAYSELEADRYYRDVYGARSSTSGLGLGTGLGIRRDLPADRSRTPWRDRPASTRASNLFSILSAEQRLELSSLERDLKCRSPGALDVHQPWVGRTSCYAGRTASAGAGACAMASDGDAESVSGSEEFDGLN